MSVGRFENYRGSAAEQADAGGLDGAEFWYGRNPLHKVGAQSDAGMNVLAGGGTRSEGNDYLVAQKIEMFGYRKQKALFALIKDDKAFDEKNLTFLPEAKQLVKDADAAFVGAWKQSKASYEVIRPGIENFRSAVMQNANAALEKLKGLSLPDEQRKKLSDALQPDHLLASSTREYPSDLYSSMSAYKELAPYNQRLSNLFGDSFMQRSQLDRICRNLAGAGQFMQDARGEEISVAEVAKMESETSRLYTEKKDIMLMTSGSHIDELLNADYPYYRKFSEPSQPKVRISGDN